MALVTLAEYEDVLVISVTLLVINHLVVTNSKVCNAINQISHLVPKCPMLWQDVCMSARSDNMYDIITGKPIHMY
jgi:hypothetical protein